MILPLPSSILGTTMARRTVAYPHNMIRAGAGAFVGRSGIHQTMEYNLNGAPTGTNDHIPRGLYVDQDSERAFAVFGDTLFYSEDYGTGEPKGLTGLTMPALNSSYPTDKLNASFAQSYSNIAIATGSNNYILDPSPTTPTLTEITDSDLPAARSVVFLDGYFLWCAADGETVHWSTVASPTSVGALDFFDAESRPDKNKELLVLGNDLFIFGERSIERFRSTGNASAPFVRVANSIISVGYVGGLTQRGDTALFIGKGVQSTFEVYEMNRSSIRPISSGAVSEILNYPNLREGILASCRAQSYVDKGVPISTFWLAGGYGAGGFYADVCFYCSINSDGTVDWGFFGDNPSNDDDSAINYREWGKTSLLPNGAAPKRMGFSWVNATEHQGQWMFQREGTLAQAGLGYLKAHANAQDRTSVVAGSTNEPISKGFRLAMDTPERDDFTLSNVEVAYSVQSSARDSLGDFTAGTDKLTLSVSTSAEDGTWTDNIEAPINDTLERVLHGRARFAPVGGIARSHGFLGLVVETNCADPIAIERVLVNV